MDKVGRIIFSECAERVLDNVMLVNIGAYDEVMFQLRKLNEWVGRFLLDVDLLVDSVTLEGGCIVLHVNEDVDYDVVNMLDCKLLVFQGKHLICKNIIDLSHPSREG